MPPLVRAGTPRLRTSRAPPSSGGRPLRSPAGSTGSLHRLPVQPRQPPCKRQTRTWTSAALRTAPARSRQQIRLGLLTSPRRPQRLHSQRPGSAPSQPRQLAERHLPWAGPAASAPLPRACSRLQPQMPLVSRVWLLPAPPAHARHTAPTCDKRAEKAGCLGQLGSTRMVWFCCVSVDSPNHAFHAACASRSAPGQQPGRRARNRLSTAAAAGRKAAGRAGRQPAREMRGHLDSSDESGEDTWQPPQPAKRAKLGSQGAPQAGVRLACGMQHG